MCWIIIYKAVLVKIAQILNTDLSRKWTLYSNHTETIIKYFVTNLNNHKTQNRSGHLVYWIYVNFELQLVKYHLF